MSVLHAFFPFLTVIPHIELKHFPVPSTYWRGTRVCAIGPHWGRSGSRTAPHDHPCAGHGADFQLQGNHGCTSSEIYEKYLKQLNTAYKLKAGGSSDNRFGDYSSEHKREANSLSLRLVARRERLEARCDVI
ncbi:hypothetical protein JYU34_006823, partial [Plutella xylostella]